MRYKLKGNRALGLTDGFDFSELYYEDSPYRKLLNYLSVEIGLQNTYMEDNYEFIIFIYTLIKDDKMIEILTPGRGKDDELIHIEKLLNEGTLTFDEFLKMMEDYEENKKKQINRDKKIDDLLK
jgi:hypothetical protein